MAAPRRNYELLKITIITEFPFTGLNSVISNLLRAVSQIFSFKNIHFAAPGFCGPGRPHHSPPNYAPVDWYIGYNVSEGLVSSTFKEVGIIS
jgi:hypothetical protein